MLKNIHDVIIRILQSASQLVQFDKEISAGLYTYILEEFGKLILVKESKSKNNQYEINCSWFKTPKAPKYKFPKAFVIWKKIIWLTGFELYAAVAV